MSKIIKSSRSTAVKGKRKVTDQNSGPQQLYEDRKLGHPDLKDAVTTELKRVRKRASKKMDNRLLSRKQRESKSSKQN